MGRNPVLQKHHKASRGSLHSLSLLFSCQQLKKTVDDLQAKLALAKGEYKTALKNLEMISDEIHERRRSSAMGPRGCGVGAEGSSTSAEDLSESKPEPDAVSGELGGSCASCVVGFQGRFHHHRRASLGWDRGLFLVGTYIL